MSRRKTHEEFLEELNNINPNIEILEKYKGSNIKLLCKCKIDKYEWYATPHKSYSFKTRMS